MGNLSNLQYRLDHPWSQAKPDWLCGQSSPSREWPVAEPLAFEVAEQAPHAFTTPPATANTHTQSQPNC